MDISPPEYKLGDAAEDENGRGQERAGPDVIAPPAVIASGAHPAALRA
jgi:hypothetical protein